MSAFLKRKEEAMKELKDLVAGDKVVVYDKYDNRRIAIVERITKTLVVVNNIKYRKSDGFASGESYIFSRRIEIPKDEEQIKAIKLEYRKRIIIHRIHNLNLNDYPLEKNVILSDEELELLITQEIGLLKIGENFILKKQRRVSNKYNLHIRKSINDIKK